MESNVGGVALLSGATKYRTQIAYGFSITKCIDTPYDQNVTSEKGKDGLSHENEGSIYMCS